MSGGVTTAQVLPGSANNIGMFMLDWSRILQSHQLLCYALGGQAFVIKLRQTADKTAISKVLEPPQSLIPNQTSDYVHWRHMKYVTSLTFLHLARILIVNPDMLAVTVLPSILFSPLGMNGLLSGENPKWVHSETRMDGMWNFRQAYDTARQIKNAQDAFCAHVRDVQAKRKSWWYWLFPEALSIEGDFPEDLQWESLVDVLRGRVKVQLALSGARNYANLSSPSSFPFIVTR